MAVTYPLARCHVSTVKNAPSKELHRNAGFFTVAVSNLHDRDATIAFMGMPRNDLTKAFVQIGNKGRQIG